MTLLKGDIPKLGRPPDRRTWCTIREAVELTGVSNAKWRERALREVSAAVAERRAALAVKAPTGGGTYRRVWHVARSLDPALAFDIDRYAARDRVRTFPQHDNKWVERARRRERWLLEWRRSCAGLGSNDPTVRAVADVVLRRARSVEGSAVKISLRAMQDWWRRYTRPTGDGEIAGIEGLIDRYVGRRQSLEGRRGAPARWRRVGSRRSRKAKRRSRPLRGTDAGGTAPSQSRLGTHGHE